MVEVGDAAAVLAGLSWISLGVATASGRAALLVSALD